MRIKVDHHTHNTARIWNKNGGQFHGTVKARIVKNMNDWRNHYEWTFASEADVTFFLIKFGGEVIND